MKYPEIYALALAATRNGTTMIIAAACAEETMERAEATGLAMARARYPVADGWGDHLCTGCVVQQRLLDMLQDEENERCK